MHWNQSTRIALLAALDMARREDGFVTVADIARRHGVSASHLAKVLRALARAGLAAASRGAAGGYRLARPAGQITLFDIVTLFEDRDRGGFRSRSDASLTDPATLALAGVFAEIEDTAFTTLRTVQLSTLIRPAAAGRRLRASGGRR